MIEFLLKLYKKPRLIIIDLILVNLAVLFSFILRFDEAWMRYFRIEYLTKCGSMPACQSFILSLKQL
jgi:hypothetical protein